MRKVGRTRSYKIETLKKRHRREWLLIQVDKVDESSTTPLTGKLIDHHPQVEKVEARLLSLKKVRNILIEYSEDSLPKGMIAAFGLREP